MHRIKTTSHIKGKSKQYHKPHKRRSLPKKTIQTNNTRNILTKANLSLHDHIAKSGSCTIQASQTAQLTTLSHAVATALQKTIDNGNNNNNNTNHINNNTTFPNHLSNTQPHNTSQRGFATKKQFWKSKNGKDRTSPTLMEQLASSNQQPKRKVSKDASYLPPGIRNLVNLTNAPQLLHGLIAINKPRGVSSGDLANFIRAKLDTIHPGLRFGFAGTLDENATGVFVGGIGQGTQFLRHILPHDKVYVARIKLGSTTDSLDVLGIVTETMPLPDPQQFTFDTVNELLQSKFVGEILQTPPSYSSLKIGTQRVSDLVREGYQVELGARKVHIKKLDLLDYDGEYITVKVHCGKGTYIRSLAADIAASLGTTGHLTQLHRAQVGLFETAIQHHDLIDDYQELLDRDRIYTGYDDSVNYVLDNQRRFGVYIPIEDSKFQPHHLEIAENLYKRYAQDMAPITEGGNGGWYPQRSGFKALDIEDFIKADKTNSIKDLILNNLVPPHYAINYSEYYNIYDEEYNPSAVKGQSIKHKIILNDGEELMSDNFKTQNAKAKAIQGVHIPNDEPTQPNVYGKPIRFSKFNYIVPKPEEEKEQQRKTKDQLPSSKSTRHALSRFNYYKYDAKDRFIHDFKHGSRYLTAYNVISEQLWQFHQEWLDSHQPLLSPTQCQKELRRILLRTGLKLDPRKNYAGFVTTEEPLNFLSEAKYNPNKIGVDNNPKHKKSNNNNNTVDGQADDDDNDSIPQNDTPVFGGEWTKQPKRVGAKIDDNGHPTHAPITRLVLGGPIPKELEERQIKITEHRYGDSPTSKNQTGDDRCVDEDAIPMSNEIDQKNNTNNKKNNKNNKDNNKNKNNENQIVGGLPSAEAEALLAATADQNPMIFEVAKKVKRPLIWLVDEKVTPLTNNFVNPQLSDYVHELNRQQQRKATKKNTTTKNNKATPISQQTQNRSFSSITTAVNKHTTTPTAFTTSPRLGLTSKRYHSTSSTNHDNDNDDNVKKEQKQHNTTHTELSQQEEHSSNNDNNSNNNTTNNDNNNTQDVSDELTQYIDGDTNTEDYSEDAIDPLTAYNQSLPPLHRDTPDGRRPKQTQQQILRDQYNAHVNAPHWALPYIVPMSSNQRQGHQRYQERINKLKQERSQINAQNEYLEFYSAASRSRANVYDSKKTYLQQYKRRVPLLYFDTKAIYITRYSNQHKLKSTPILSTQNEFFKQYHLWSRLTRDVNGNLLQFTKDGLLIHDIFGVVQDAILERYPDVNKYYQYNPKDRFKVHFQQTFHYNARLDQFINMWLYTQQLNEPFIHRYKKTKNNNRNDGSNNNNNEEEVIEIPNKHPLYGFNNKEILHYAPRKMNSKMNSYFNRDLYPNDDLLPDYEAYKYNSLGMVQYNKELNDRQSFIQRLKQHAMNDYPEEQQKVVDDEEEKEKQQQKEEEENIKITQHQPKHIQTFREKRMQMRRQKIEHGRLQRRLELETTMLEHLTQQYLQQRQKIYFQRNVLFQEIKDLQTQYNQLQHELANNKQKFDLIYENNNLKQQISEREEQLMLLTKKLSNQQQFISQQTIRQNTNTTNVTAAHHDIMFGMDDNDMNDGINGMNKNRNNNNKRDISFGFSGDENGLDPFGHGSADEMNSSKFYNFNGSGGVDDDEVLYQQMHKRKVFGGSSGGSNNNISGGGFAASPGMFKRMGDDGESATDDYLYEMLFKEENKMMDKTFNPHHSHHVINSSSSQKVPGGGATHHDEEDPFSALFNTQVVKKTNDISSTQQGINNRQQQKKHMNRTMLFSDAHNDDGDDFIAPASQQTMNKRKR